MKITVQKSAYGIDLKLILIHSILLIFSYLIYKSFAYTPQQKDMSGLFLLIISVLGGFVGLILLALSLLRLDRSIRNIRLFKVILAFVYWISSSTIFIFLGLSKFFYNNPLVAIIFAILFLTSLYFSVVRLADMRKKDWFILLGVYSFLVLFFFSPEF